MTSTPDGRWFAGLMSGTSLDGTDAVLLRLTGDRPSQLRHLYHPFSSDLRQRLLALQNDSYGDLGLAAVAARDLADHYADTLNTLLAHCSIPAIAVCAVGAHGQTVRHRPELGYTVQLLDGARLAQRCGVLTVCDFRSGDIAAGGQGAPLVPAFHAAMFSPEDNGDNAALCVVNIGGMANLTVLRRDTPTPVIGFDVGPGNVLLDAWVQRHRGEPYDREGAWAAGGTVDEALLRHLLGHPFFQLAPPKSCGREQFDVHWLDRVDGLDALAPQDVQATLAQLTAQSIADAVRQQGRTATLLLCGGGAHNADLAKRLRNCLPGITVETTASRGIDPQQVEAAAFAWLAMRRIEGLPGNLPAVTGARSARVLGAIYAV